MDYRDGDQKKWLPWFNVLSPAGVSFNDTNTRMRMRVTQLFYIDDAFEPNDPDFIEITKKEFEETREKFPEKQ